MPDEGAASVVGDDDGRLERLRRAGAAHLLRDFLVGVEKESLRVGTNGGIAQTPHPRALGSALTHPTITTDYSEALLEFVTPPFPTTAQVYDYLLNLHGFVYQALDGEILWAGSMPCVLEGEQSIPIAEYGSSNAGMMKHVYRRGLGYRYGRTMQVIAGVHFNFSLSDAVWAELIEWEGGGRSRQQFIADSYFGMIRNLQRFGWLVPYLFGASPAVCRSFFADRDDRLEAFDTTTRYLPFATSLRVSDIGYQNRKEKRGGLQVSYDSLESYLSSLQWAIDTPYPEFAAIGVQVDGEWRQLNANLLQIENEYYSSIRPKQPFDIMETPSQAMRRRGVRYVELRSLDLNPFDPAGVDTITLRFLSAFLSYCALRESPQFDAGERSAIDHNQHLVATAGRDPALRLQQNGGGEVTLKHWARQILEAMDPVCEILDGDAAEQPYGAALRRQRELVDAPDATPSARVLEEMRANDEGFFEYTMRVSQKHAQALRSLELPADLRAELEREAVRSLARQRELEQADQPKFGQFLDRYFARARV
jgi:glutamate--cysteine ligase